VKECGRIGDWDVLVVGDRARDEVRVVRVGAVLLPWRMKGGSC
jgi:hypothetical protein